MTSLLKGGYGVIFRVYNGGLAYRFFTQMKADMTILTEVANFNFKDNIKAFFLFVNDYRNHDKFTTSFEAHYKKINIAKLSADSLTFLHVLADLGQQKR